MSLIGTNIKKIRGVKGLSQTSFANLFGLTRANIGSYEEQRAEPKLDVILKIADYYKIEIGKLVTKELTVNEISNFNLIEEVLFNKKTADSGVLFIGKEELTKYPKEKENQEFLKTLAKLNVPFLDSKKETLAIYNEGNELYFDNHGFLHGDVLFLEKQDLKENKTMFFGVVIDDSIIAKGLIRLNNKIATITPTNPNFEQTEIEITKKVTVWKITGRYTENILDKEFLVSKVIAMEKGQK